MHFSGLSKSKKVLERTRKRINFQKKICVLSMWHISELRSKRMKQQLDTVGMKSLLGDRANRD